MEPVEKTEDSPIIQREPRLSVSKEALRRKGPPMFRRMINDFDRKLSPLGKVTSVRVIREREGTPVAVAGSVHAEWRSGMKARYSFSDVRECSADEAVRLISSSERGAVVYSCSAGIFKPQAFSDLSDDAEVLLVRMDKKSLFSDTLSGPWRRILQIEDAPSDETKRLPEVSEQRPGSRNDRNSVPDESKF